MDRNEIEEWLRSQEYTVEQLRARWEKVVADDCRSFADLQLADERERACQIVRHLLQAQRWRKIEEAPENIPFADVFVVTRRDGGLVCQMRVPNAQHRDGKWYDNGGYEINKDTIEPDGVHYTRAITHFMEQPQPPSTEKERDTVRAAE